MKQRFLILIFIGLVRLAYGDSTREIEKRALPSLSYALVAPAQSETVINKGKFLSSQAREQRQSSSSDTGELLQNGLDDIIHSAAIYSSFGLHSTVEHYPPLKDIRYSQYSGFPGQSSFLKILFKVIISSNAP